MMLPRTRKSVRSSVLIRARISATPAGRTGGLGTVYIWATGTGPSATDYHYPDPDRALFDDERITDQSNSDYKANGIYFIRNDQGAEKQLEHFVPDRTNGLTSAGLRRIDRSIEAFGYCILGAQARTLSSIVGFGMAKNTQAEFFTLVEDAIKTQTPSNGAAHYQDGIQKTNVRLNFVVARGALLLPARMIINTERVVRYNNNLMHATADMKLGVNNQVNQGKKKASLKLMAGGPSKVNPPNNHPSNLIHKQTTEAQGLAQPATRAPPATKPATPATQPATPATQPATPVTQPATPATHPATTSVSSPPAAQSDVDAHHVNKALIAVGALAIVGLFI